MYCNEQTRRIAKESARLAQLLSDEVAINDAIRRFRETVGGPALDDNRIDFLVAGNNDYQTDTDALKIDVSIKVDEDEFWALSPWFKWSTFLANSAKPMGSIDAQFGRYLFRCDVHGPVNQSDLQTLREIGKIGVSAPPEYRPTERIVCAV